MLGRRACVWFRLAYFVLAAWLIVLATHYVEQDRYEVVGIRSDEIAVFDHLYGSAFIAPLSEPQTDGMIVPPRSY